MEAMAEIHSCPDISIHAPREGSDVLTPLDTQVLEVFLSTLPVRGATTSRTFRRPAPRNFYPRSP